MTLDRAERRSYREYRPYDTERQADFPPEKFTDENQLTGLIETDHCEDVEAQEGACEAEAEVVLGTELLTVLTREGNENLRDTVGMIK